MYNAFILIKPKQKPENSTFAIFRKKSQTANATTLNSAWKHTFFHSSSIGMLYAVCDDVWCKNHFMTATPNKYFIIRIILFIRHYFLIVQWMGIWHSFVEHALLKRFHSIRIVYAFMFIMFTRSHHHYLCNAWDFQCCCYRYRRRLCLW